MSTFDQLHEHCEKRHDGVVRLVFRLKQANPRANFTQAEELLMQAESVIVQCGALGVVSRSDRDLIANLLNAAADVANEIAANDCKERFEQLGKTFYLSREARRTVLQRAEKELVDGNRASERTVYLTAIGIIREFADAGKEMIENRLREQFAETERTPATVIVTSTTKPLVSSLMNISSAHTRQERREKKVSRHGGHFIGESRQANVQVRPDGGPRSPS